MTSKSPKYPLSAEQIAAYYIEEHSRPGSARVYVLDPTRFAMEPPASKPVVTAPPAAPEPEQEQPQEVMPVHRFVLGNIVIVLGGPRSAITVAGLLSSKSPIAAPIHTWLVQQARKNHRSLNAEIEYRLTKQREAENAVEQKK
jgi:hypothetical protein